MDLILKVQKKLKKIAFYPFSIAKKYLSISCHRQVLKKINKKIKIILLEEMFP